MTSYTSIQQQLVNESNKSISCTPEETYNYNATLNCLYILKTFVPHNLFLNSGLDIYNEMMIKLPTNNTEFVERILNSPTPFVEFCVKNKEAFQYHSIEQIVGNFEYGDKTTNMKELFEQLSVKEWDVISYFMYNLANV